MSYRDLTERQAVLDAILEFDQIGREAFLTKYKFHEASKYFVLHNNRRYDCKPLLWGAYWHQHGTAPNTGATGGVRNGIQPHLEQLGFHVIGDEQTLEEAESVLQDKVTKSFAELSEQRQARLLNAPKKPSQLVVISTAYNRNADVIAEVLSQAKGLCADCKSPAPFISARSGGPYLEVHHVKRLADGGDDTVENTVALCPNCHRKQHFGSKEVHQS